MLQPIPTPTVPPLPGITAPLPAARPTATQPLPTPVLSMRGITKRYGSVDALRGIDLDVHQGEVVAILGPNGAGKSTAIGILLGLRSPSDGTVRVLGGHPDDPAVRARTGAMLQQSGVAGTLTVAELIDLFRGYYPAPRLRVDLLAAADLTDLASRRIRTLSGGQLQRLYFALALAGDPELVFLDEPTTGMDLESRRRFWEVIGGLAGRGTTILFATHLLEEADALASRIVVIDRGRIVGDGSPAAIKATAGGATIRLRADGLDPATRDELPAWDGVMRIASAGHRLEIVARDPADILRRLFATPSRIEELAIEEHALETAFLHLVTSETDR